MDHKISKDMISSGMIPSGEKTQADLGRTQYGSAPSPSSLMDAYKTIYEHHQKDENGNTIPHEDEDIKEENLDEINAGYSTDPGLAATPKPKVSNLTRQGKERTPAQMAAAKRIASGKSIADVKAANTASMRSSARARNVDFRAERRPAAKPMASNPQGMRQQGVGKSANDLSRHSTGGTLSKVSSSASSNTSNRRAMMSRRRRGLMNDVDLFDLIKGAFIEEGYNESDALSFMVEASPEYLAELDREATMLGLAATSAIPFVAKKLFGKKVDKTIKQQRKTSTIGGENRKNKIEKAAGAEGFFK